MIHRDDHSRPTCRTRKASSLVTLAVLCLSPPLVSSQAVSAEPHTPLREFAQRHGIRISAAASPNHLAEAEYSAILGSEFSGLEPENAMKFAPIHPRPNSDPQPFDFVAADQLIAFAKLHNMRVRGHTLVWHRQIPDWVTKGNHTSQELNAILQNHISKVLSHFGDSVFAYDVVNEAFNDDGSMRSTVWYDQPGIGFSGQGTAYVEQALKWAHQANARVKLFYNDYDVETVNKKSNAMYRMAEDFVHRGVPIDGVGLQMHVDLGFDDDAKLKSLVENMRRFGKLGLEVHITELDVSLPSGDPTHLKKQGDLYEKIVRACLNEPACKLMQTWGITDKYSWIPSSRKGYGWALPWDADYKPKPAFEAIQRALH